MPKVSVPYLVERTGANGLPRYYWQPSATLRAQGWQAQRVPADWQTISDPDALHRAAVARAQELNAGVRRAAETQAIAATRTTPPPAQRTVSELIAMYRRSDKWSTLAPKTRRGYGQCLDRIEAWAGDAPVAVIDEARIQKLKQAWRATPAFANAIIRVLRLLLEHARRLSWITHNPALRPDLAGTPPSGLIWPREAVTLMVQTADAKGWYSIGTAITLNEWLGQREGDILRMPRQALRAGNLVVRQGKTKAGVTLPIAQVPHLQARLAEELARLDARAAPGAPIATTILVCETTGLPWKEDHFRHAFAAVRALAAETTPAFPVDHLMPGRDMTDPEAFLIATRDLTFMHLRHTAVTRLAEADIDTSLIASITGHSLATVNQIIERYMVRTSKMASLAFARRMTAEGIGEGAASVEGVG
jgi:hypothetical protein